MQKVSNPWSQHQKLQEDWIGTQGISISLCLLTLFAGIPLLGAAGRNPGHGTKIARGLDWYKDIGYYFIKSMSLLKPGATRCHGTRIVRGVPLPVYINLDLYSGFWCTSRCVVF